jgi:hypothetical protein
MVHLFNGSVLIPMTRGHTGFEDYSVCYARVSVDMNSNHLCYTQIFGIYCRFHVNTRTNGHAKTEISLQIIGKRMIGVKPVDFNPDSVICNPRGNPINYVWMGESEMPGDEYIGKEKKWCIQFHSKNLQSATIYFDEVDARKFKEKVIESLEGLM